MAEVPAQAQQAVAGLAGVVQRQLRLHAADAARHLDGDAQRGGTGLGDGETVGGVGGGTGRTGQEHGQCGDPPRQRQGRKRLHRAFVREDGKEGKVL